MPLSLQCVLGIGPVGGLDAAHANIYQRGQHLYVYAEAMFPHLDKA